MAATRYMMALFVEGGLVLRSGPLRGEGSCCDSMHPASERRGERPGRSFRAGEVATGRSRTAPGNDSEFSTSSYATPRQFTTRQPPPTGRPSYNRQIRVESTEWGGKECGVGSAEYMVGAGGHWQAQSASAAVKEEIYNISFFTTETQRIQREKTKEVLSSGFLGVLWASVVHPMSLRRRGELASNVCQCRATRLGRTRLAVPGHHPPGWRCPTRRPIMGRGRANSPPRPDQGRNPRT